MKSPLAIIFFVGLASHRAPAAEGDALFSTEMSAAIAREIQEFHSADAVAEVAARVRDGNWKFLGYSGGTMEPSFIPGLTPEEVAQYVDARGDSWEIYFHYHAHFEVGSRDERTMLWEARLNYAGRVNRALLERIRKQDEPSVLSQRIAAGALRFSLPADFEMEEFTEEDSFRVRYHGVGITCECEVGSELLLSPVQAGMELFAIRQKHEDAGALQSEESVLPVGTHLGLMTLAEGEEFVRYGGYPHRAELRVPFSEGGFVVVRVFFRGPDQRELARRILHSVELVAAAATVARSEAQNPGGRKRLLLRRAEAAAVAGTIRGARLVEIIALDPAVRIGDARVGAIPSPTDDSLFGFKILGTARVEASAAIERLAASLEASVDESGGFLAMCFEPRHALRIRRPSGDFVLVVCFQCLKAHIEGLGDLNLVSVTPTPEPEWDEIFRAHGLPKAK